jgi:hypothetical protein
MAERDAGRVLPKEPVVSRGDVLLRAQMSVGTGTYGLGKGGRKPLYHFPWSPDDTKRLVDCSGFVAWCLGVDRHFDFDGDGQREWLETTAVYNDATGAQLRFERVDDAEEADVIVYPDRKIEGKRHEGHIGIVSRVSEDGSVAAVIHCSTGNQRKTGNAIAETNPRVFQLNGAIVARFKGIA